MGLSEGKKGTSKKEGGSAVVRGARDYRKSWDDGDEGGVSE